MHTACALVIAIGAIGAGSAAAATMYKWVDEKGQVIYSDQPPPGVKAEVVKPPPPPANPNAAKELANAEAEMKQREKQRIEKAEKAEKARQDAEKKQEVCTRARQQIATLQREDLYRFNEKGERYLLDADMRAKEAEEQQKIVRDNCGPAAG